MYALGRSVRGELDDRLVSDLRARRPEALDELLRRFGPEIHAVAFMTLRNASDAEEVTADTLLTAWRRIDTLRDADRVRPWLLRIATRLALRRWRRPRVRTLPLELAGELTEASAGIVDRLALANAIDGLPPRTRAAVALHYVADLAVADVADVLGTSPNTVKTQLREGLAKLREAMS